MNKYIISQLIMSLLVAFQVSAMESNVVPIDKDPSVPNSDVYCLGNMPTDIQNNIKYFVTCDDETDEEFITRIAIESEKRLPFGQILFDFCPDKTKSIEWVYGSNMQSTLMISNVENDNNSEVLYTKKSTNGGFCERIALSSAGDVIALLYHAWSPASYLLIRNIHTEQELSKEIHSPFEVKTIAFNKNGTRLIAYGMHQKTKENMHKMFYLKKIDKKPENVVDLSKSPVIEVKENKLQINELQNYFRDKLVCNNRIEGLK